MKQRSVPCANGATNRVSEVLSEMDRAAIASIDRKVLDGQQLRNYVEEILDRIAVIKDGLSVEVSQFRIKRFASRNMFMSTASPPRNHEIGCLSQVFKSLHPKSPFSKCKLTTTSCTTPAMRSLGILVCCLIPAMMRQEGYQTTLSE